MGHRNRVGAKGKVIVEGDGNRLELESEVIRSEEAKLLEVKITNSMFEIASVYELLPKGDETQIKLTMQADYRGYARLFAPFVGGEMQRKLDADFERLKRIVEAEQAGGGD